MKKLLASLLMLAMICAISLSSVGCGGDTKKPATDAAKDKKDK